MIIPSNTKVIVQSRFATPSVQRITVRPMQTDGHPLITKIVKLESAATRVYQIFLSHPDYHSMWVNCKDVIA